MIDRVGARPDRGFDRGVIVAVERMERLQPPGRQRLGARIRFMILTPAIIVARSRGSDR